MTKNFICSRCNESVHLKSEEASLGSGSMNVKIYEKYNWLLSIV